MLHWAPPAPTSRSGPEGIYWGKSAVSSILLRRKVPQNMPSGPLGEVGIEGAFESKLTSQTLVCIQ